MVINEFFLNSSVESLAVRIHLRGLGIGMVMGEMKLAKRLGKMFLEFRTIIGKHVHKAKGMREYHLAIVKEFSGGKGGVTLSRPGKAKAGVNVFKGDDVSPAAIDEAFNGIQSNQMTRICRLEISWLSQYLLSFDGLYSPIVVNLLRKHSQPSAVLDEASYGAYRGAWQLLCKTEFSEKRMDFVFSKVGIGIAQPLYLIKNFRGPQAFPSLLWSAGGVIECFKPSFPFLEFLFP